MNLQCSNELPFLEAPCQRYHQAEEEQRPKRKEKVYWVPSKFKTCTQDHDKHKTSV